MALQGRHRYIVQKLDEAFEIHDENATEALVQTEPVLEKINHFFRGDGPSRLIFYYVHSGSDPYGDPYHELIVSDGSNLPLAEKAVFFLKTVKAPTPGSDESIPPDLDPTTATDGALSYGVVAAALPSLETAVERLYKPLLSAQTEREWGLAQGTERIEFLTSLDSLVASLQESAKSANSNLELATPDADLEQQVSAPDAASDPALVAHLANMVEDWCLQVEALLNGGNSGSGGAGTGGVGSGPDTEIEYWRRRLQQLTSVTDQLKARPCKNVLAVLTAAASMKAPTTGGNNAAMVNKARSLALLRQWRQVDVKLTESSNEAKDNVKWLATLERYMEPLYSGDPEAILDLIPALIGSVKMIHTASRFYNTSQRIGALLASFSYQIMAACTLCVNGKDPPDALFDRPPEFVLRVLESCLKLNEKFQEQYHLAKDQLQAFPKGKQFDFSEFLLFGTLDAFCRRAVKLMDVFASVQQFQALASARVEGSASLLVAHDATLTAFRKKNHPLLDVSEGPAQARCEAELAQLLVQLDANEVQLKALVDTSFAHAISAEARLDLLATYAPVLKRPELKAHLDAKLQAALVAYASELAIVQSMYEHDKHAPPVPRNTPPVAGAVAWCRQLLRRIDAPMQRFQASFSKAKDDPSSQPPPAAFKPIVKTYNKVARALVSFEYVWLDAWQKSVHSAQEGLQATLVVKHPKTGKLFVNLDREVLQLAHESKCLRRLGVELPDAALAVLAQEAHIKDVALRLGEMLESFAAATEKILPVTLKCLASHISVVEDALRPGLVSLTWTSLNVRTYLDSVGNAVAQLSELIGQVNDLVDNRIDRPLSAMAQVALIKLPDPADERLLSLDTFIEMQELAALSATATLQAKNSAVEAAVGDLVALIVEKKNLNSTSNSAASSNVPAAALSQLRAHYNALAYRALLSATRNALNATKKRVCSRAGSGFLFAQRPLFEVDIQLSVPSVRLSPTLDDVQHAINRTAVTVMACSKRVWQWGQLSVPEAEKRSFFDILGCDLEIIKVSLLLTGALHNTKSAVSKYLSTFRMYDWIWKEDKDEAYQRFLATTPMTADFEAELRRFLVLESEIDKMQSSHDIGALALHTANLKLQLRNESRLWKVQYSNKVHNQAKMAMKNLAEYIRLTASKLKLDVKNIDNLRYVIEILREVRERDASIELEIAPCADLYGMLEKYLPGALVSKAEMDQLRSLRPSWRKLVSSAEAVADSLSGLQGDLKKTLMADVRAFGTEVLEFRADFEKHGPGAHNVSPDEAIERLKKYRGLLQAKEARRISLAMGEELFALKNTEFPLLARTERDITQLDSLYSLYARVVAADTAYRQLPWISVPGQLDDMASVIRDLNAQCRALPKQLRVWKAFVDLESAIAALDNALPVVRDLAKASMKPRHWAEVNEVLLEHKSRLEYDSPTFTLGDVLDSAAVAAAPALKDISAGADRQLTIETELADVKEHWDHRAFSFTPAVKNRQEVMLLTNVDMVIDEIEDALVTLQSLLASPYVGPFKEQVLEELKELSDTTEVIHTWLAVQNAWSALESVFTAPSSDAAKRIPATAKRFAKADLEFVKIMKRGAATRGVVAACSNDLLKTSLPVLFAEIEKCQRAVDGYLEQKRIRFPRFYFVSNKALLVILSKGNDLVAMQGHYAKLFAGVTSVDHGAHGIESICSESGEAVQLARPVFPTGSVEDWLGALEKEMQMTLKALAERCAEDCLSPAVPLSTFVESTCAQLALLGLHMSWTHACGAALDAATTNRHALPDNGQVQARAEHELLRWCQGHRLSAQDRLKLEALAMAQQHFNRQWVQCERTATSHGRSVSSSDFVWQKQMRVYWQPQVNDRHGPGSCSIRVCDASMNYGYEYLGATERLVATPLTERCYLAVTQALSMHRGSALVGPSGVGKTETVRDLGRTTGLNVVVTKCSHHFDAADLARHFKGISQSGAWGCFDDLDRLGSSTLSLLAQQILAISAAQRAQMIRFVFPGDTKAMYLSSSAAYFAAMQPAGVQGRLDLPISLKVFFRVVQLVSPDFETIVRVRLYIFGYSDAAVLARKVALLFEYCENQLTRQHHYHFGLLSMLRALAACNHTILAQPSARGDENLLVRALRDAVVPMLLPSDVPLFLTLLSEMFPLQQPPSVKDAATQSLESDLCAAAEARGFIAYTPWIAKVLQFHETTSARRGVLLLGATGSGKSAALSVLQDVLVKRSHRKLKETRIYPCALKVQDVWGGVDRSNGQWVDGVLANVWANANANATARQESAWVVCDGDVHSSWAEHWHSALDHTNAVTLADGGRWPMEPNVQLVLEAEDMRHASPAMVGRMGVVHFSDKDLDWSTLLEAWRRKAQQSTASPNSSASATPPVVVGLLMGCFAKLVGPPLEADLPNQQPRSSHLLDFFDKKCSSNAALGTMPRAVVFSHTLRLLDSCLQVANFSVDSPEVLAAEVERLLLFALCWSIGGALVEAKDRTKFDTFLRPLSEQMPPLFVGPPPAAEGTKASTDKRTSSEGGKAAPPPLRAMTAFDYRLNLESMEWEPWQPETKLPPLMHGLGAGKRGSIHVPTADGARAQQLLELLHLHQRRPVLLAGARGCGKTTAAHQFLPVLDASMPLCFTAATRLNALQQCVENELEPRGGKSLGPRHGKARLTFFLDDLNLPEENNWGNQPPLELVRQLVEAATLCHLDREHRGNMRDLVDLSYIGAVQTSSLGGSSSSSSSSGSNVLPARLQRHFFPVVLSAPSDETVVNLFAPVLHQRFPAATISPDLALVLSRVPAATAGIWGWARKTLRASPSRGHYVFERRDVTRILEGICRVPVAKVLPSHENFVLLWRHECERAMMDKLSTADDKQLFLEQLNAATSVVMAEPEPEPVDEVPLAPAAPPSDKKGGKTKKGGPGGPKGGRGPAKKKEPDVLVVEEEKEPPPPPPKMDPAAGVLAMEPIYFADIMEEDDDDEEDEDLGLVMDASAMDGTADEGIPGEDGVPGEEGNIAGEGENAEASNVNNADDDDNNGALMLLDDNANGPVYREGGTLAALRPRAQALLDEFYDDDDNDAAAGGGVVASSSNGLASPPAQPQPSRLVLFDDALAHLLAVGRVLGTPGGCVCLVGDPGSGKRSLAALGGFVAGHATVTLHLSGGGGGTSSSSLAAAQQSREELRDLVRIAAESPVTLVLVDAETTTGSARDANNDNEDNIDSRFLETEEWGDVLLDLVSALVATGEAPGLFLRNELTRLAATLRDEAARRRADFVDSPAYLRNYLAETVKAHLHMVLCLPASPQGHFASRARRFPALMSTCVVNWWRPWPRDAWLAVSRSLAAPIALPIALLPDNDEGEGGSSSGGGVGVGPDGVGGSGSGFMESVVDQASSNEQGSSALVDINGSGGIGGSGLIDEYNDDGAIISPRNDPKDALVHHFAAVHAAASTRSRECAIRTSRPIVCGPDTFKYFVERYTSLYAQKAKSVEAQAQRVRIALDKLEQGERDEEAMQLELNRDEVELRQADESTVRLLSQLEESSMVTKKETDAVDTIKHKCDADAAYIKAERAAADALLATAQPFVQSAERALGNVKAADLKELSQLTKPSDIVKLVFDAIGLLRQEPMAPVELTEITLGIGQDKKTYGFIADSFKMLQAGMMTDARLQQSLLLFTKLKRDLINEETLEFLAPYLYLDGFTPTVALNASKAAEALCQWVRAIVSYCEASREVKPKLQALMLAEATLSDARKLQDVAQGKLNIAQDKLDKLKEDFEVAMADKKKVTEKTVKMRDQMSKVRSLVDGLSDERAEWASAASEFENARAELVGNVSLAAAMCAYGGPLDAQARSQLLEEDWVEDLDERELPFSEGFDFVDFLTGGGGDESTRNPNESSSSWGGPRNWIAHSLPQDPRCLENGLLVAQATSTKWPLLIDPQGVGARWILACEGSKKNRLPTFRSTMLSHEALRDRLEFCLSEGYALLISDLSHGTDVMSHDSLLSALVAKDMEIKATGHAYVRVGGKLCNLHSKFALYLTTQLAAPCLPPTLQAATVVVDFTLPMPALEGEWLGATVRREAFDLEVSFESLALNIADLDAQLAWLNTQIVAELAAEEGALLEDTTLVASLASAKAKAVSATHDLRAAEEEQASVEAQRAVYYPLAKRCGVLYQATAALTRVHSMYAPLSVEALAALLGQALDLSPPAGHSSSSSSLSQTSNTTTVADSSSEGHHHDHTHDRLMSAVDHVTWLTFRTTARSIFARHLPVLQLLLAVQLLESSGVADHEDAALLLRLPQTAPPPQPPHADTHAGTIDLGAPAQVLPSSNDLSVNETMPSNSEMVKNSTNEETVDVQSARGPKPAWLSEEAWWRAIHVGLSHARSMQPFRDLPDELARASNDIPDNRSSIVSNRSSTNGHRGSDLTWQAWYEAAEPETIPVPHYEHRLTDDPEKGPLWRLLLVRALRPDRLMFALHAFLRAVPTVPGAAKHGHHDSEPAPRLPGLGDRYAEPIRDTFEATIRSSSPWELVLFLLDGSQKEGAGSGGGSDEPTASLVALAARAQRPLEIVAMGRGAEPTAARALHKACAAGSWVLLQNCHLNLDFLESTVEHTLHRVKAVGNPTFRVLATAQEHIRFPAGVLQRAVRFCINNAAMSPVGLRAGVASSLLGLVTRERLERVSGGGAPQWRSLCFVLCVLHSALHARRKYGAVGWGGAHPTLDFGSSPDLEGCLVFLERHLQKGPLSWPALQAMVVHVHYAMGDIWDERLLDTYAHAWLSPPTLTPNFAFNLSPYAAADGGSSSGGGGGSGSGSGDVNNYAYRVLAGVRSPAEEANLGAVIEHTWPEYECPSVLGLHPHEAFAYRARESSALFTALSLAHGQHAPSDSSATHHHHHHHYHHHHHHSSTTSSDDARFVVQCQSMLATLPKALGAVAISEAVRRLGGVSDPINACVALEAGRVSAAAARARKDLSAAVGVLNGDIQASAAHLTTLRALRAGQVPASWSSFEFGVLRSPLSSQSSEGASTAPDQAAAGAGARAGENASLPSSLAKWVEGLAARDAPLRSWLRYGFPRSVWLGGLTAPRGFIVALLRGAALANEWDLDCVGLKCEVTNLMEPPPPPVAAPGAPPDVVPTPPPRVLGASLVHGLSIEGAAWDSERHSLCELQPKQLSSAFPLFMLSGSLKDSVAPSEVNAGQWIYQCPVYHHAGRSNAAWIFTVGLPSSDYQPGNWIVRGVGILCLE